MYMCVVYLLIICLPCFFFATCRVCTVFEGSDQELKAGAGVQTTKKEGKEKRKKKEAKVETPHPSFHHTFSQQEICGKEIMELI